MKYTVYIGLGSNVGNRKKNLYKAISYLKEMNISVVQMSSVYETSPVGVLNQPFFLNMVIRADTSLKPLALLQVINEIENKMGRRRQVRWGSRNIDLDILLFDNQTIDIPRLTIPHPRMKERAFVLIPLHEIAPNLLMPDGTSVADMVKNLDLGSQSVTLFCSLLLKEYN